MNRWLVGYGAVVLTLLVLDILWLGFVAKSLYAQGIGHLMAEQPRLGVAALFYALYAVGVMGFVVSPGLTGETAAWGRTLLLGAGFGIVCYATYDLSNLATLKAWPASLAAIDIAWGAVLTLASAAAGKAAVDALTLKQGL